MDVSLALWERSSILLQRAVSFWLALVYTLIRHMFMYTHTYTHPHTHIHTGTHTHTHTHTHTKAKQKSKVPRCLNKVTLPGKSRMPVN